MPMEIHIRLKNVWRFVAAALPRPSLFATAPTQKLDSEPRKKQCQNRPRISGSKLRELHSGDKGSTRLVEVTRSVEAQCLSGKTGRIRKTRFAVTLIERKQFCS